MSANKEDEEAAPPQLMTPSINNHNKSDNTPNEVNVTETCKLTGGKSVCFASPPRRHSPRFLFSEDANSSTSLHTSTNNDNKSKKLISPGVSDRTHIASALRSNKTSDGISNTTQKVIESKNKKGRKGGQKVVESDETVLESGPRQSLLDIMRADQEEPAGGEREGKADEVNRQGEVDLCFSAAIAEGGLLLTDSIPVGEVCEEERKEENHQGETSSDADHLTSNIPNNDTTSSPPQSLLPCPSTPDSTVNSQEFITQGVLLLQILQQKTENVLVDSELPLSRVEEKGEEMMDPGTKEAPSHSQSLIITAGHQLPHSFSDSPHSPLQSCSLSVSPCSSLSSLSSLQHQDAEIEIYGEKKNEAASITSSSSSANITTTSSADNVTDTTDTSYCSTSLSTLTASPCSPRPRDYRTKQLYQLGLRGSGNDEKVGEESRVKGIAEYSQEEEEENENITIDDETKEAKEANGGDENDNSEEDGFEMLLSQDLSLTPLPLSNMHISSSPPLLSLPPLPSTTLTPTRSILKRKSSYNENTDEKLVPPPVQVQPQGQTEDKTIVENGNKRSEMSLRIDVSEETDGKASSDTNEGKIVIDISSLGSPSRSSTTTVRNKNNSCDTNNISSDTHSNIAAVTYTSSSSSSTSSLQPLKKTVSFDITASMQYKRWKAGKVADFSVEDAIAECRADQALKEKEKQKRLRQRGEMGEMGTKRGKGGGVGISSVDEEEEGERRSPGCSAPPSRSGSSLSLSHSSISSITSFSSSSSLASLSTTGIGVAVVSKSETILSDNNGTKVSMEEEEENEKVDDGHDSTAECSVTVNDTELKENISNILTTAAVSTIPPLNSSLPPLAPQSHLESMTLAEQEEKTEMERFAGTVGRILSENNFMAVDDTVESEGELSRQQEENMVEKGDNAREEGDEMVMQVCMMERNHHADSCVGLNIDSDDDEEAPVTGRESVALASSTSPIPVTDDISAALVVPLLLENNVHSVTVLSSPFPTLGLSPLDPPPPIPPALAVVSQTQSQPPPPLPPPVPILKTRSAYTLTLLTAPLSPPLISTVRRRDSNSLDRGQEGGRNASDTSQPVLTLPLPLSSTSSHSSVDSLCDPYSALQGYPANTVLYVDEQGVVRDVKETFPSRPSLTGSKATGANNTISERNDQPNDKIGAMNTDGKETFSPPSHRHELLPSSSAIPSHPPSHAHTPPPRNSVRFAPHVTDNVSRRGMYLNLKQRFQQAVLQRQLKIQQWHREQAALKVRLRRSVAQRNNNNNTLSSSSSNSTGTDAGESAEGEGKERQEEASTVVRGEGGEGQPASIKKREKQPHTSHHRGSGQHPDTTSAQEEVKDVAPVAADAHNDITAYLDKAAQKQSKLAQAKSYWQAYKPKESSGSFVWSKRRRVGETEEDEPKQECVGDVRGEEMRTKNSALEQSIPPSTTLSIYDVPEQLQNTPHPADEYGNNDATRQEAEEVHAKKEEVKEEEERGENPFRRGQTEVPAQYKVRYQQLNDTTSHCNSKEYKKGNNNVYPLVRTDRYEYFTPAGASESSCNEEMNHSSDAMNVDTHLTTLLLSPPSVSAFPHPSSTSSSLPLIQSDSSTEIDEEEEEGRVDDTEFNGFNVGKTGEMVDETTVSSAASLAPSTTSDAYPSDVSLSHSSPTPPEVSKEQEDKSIDTTAVQNINTISSPDKQPPTTMTLEAADDPTAVWSPIKSPVPHPYFRRSSPTSQQRFLRRLRVNNPVTNTNAAAATATSLSSTADTHEQIDVLSASMVDSVSAAAPAEVLIQLSLLTIVTSSFSSTVSASSVYTSKRKVNQQPLSLQKKTKQYSQHHNSSSDNNSWTEDDDDWFKEGEVHSAQWKKARWEEILSYGSQEEEEGEAVVEGEGKVKGKSASEEKGNDKEGMIETGAIMEGEHKLQDEKSLLSSAPLHFPALTLPTETISANLSLSHTLLSFKEEDDDDVIVLYSSPRSPLTATDAADGVEGTISSSPPSFSTSLTAAVEEEEHSPDVMVTVEEAGTENDDLLTPSSPPSPSLSDIAVTTSVSATEPFLNNNHTQEDTMSVGDGEDENEEDDDRDVPNFVPSQSYDDASMQSVVQDDELFFGAGGV